MPFNIVMKEKLTAKNIMLFIVGNVVSCFSGCLILKASIGSGAYSALSKAAAPLLGIKIGTFSMITNGICVFVQYLCLRKEFGLRHVLQLGMNTVSGLLTNFFYYDLLGNFTIDNYILKVLTVIVCDCINAACVALLLNLDIVTTSLGGCCHAVSNRLGTKYATIRQSVDIICIVIVLFCVFVYHSELTLREGTVLNTLLFGHWVDFWLARTKKIID